MNRETILLVQLDWKEIAAYLQSVTSEKMEYDLIFSRLD